MNEALILVPFTPFALAVLIALAPPLRPVLRRLVPVSAVPAILTPILVGTIETADIPWFLLGTQVGLDTTGQVFLFFSGLLWALAGWYGVSYLAHDEHDYRFQAFYLLAMSGNLGLIVAQDLVMFYAAFGLMTFSSAGVIVHDATRFAVRATTLYVILSIVGEFLLLVGLFQVAMAAGSIAFADVPGALAAAGDRHITIALLFAGFGIKAGLPFVHIWLPLAHPAAPTPASAVLSGVMIKAGLLGWIRFLPAGEANFPEWGWICIALGLTGAFGGVVLGLVQTSPKANLAYSSISQMGLITVGLGLGFLEAAAWPAVLTALAVFALHHGLAKGTLFLAVGVAGTVARSEPARWATMAGVALAVLALAGAPFTSGMVAKGLLKENLPVTGDWYGTLSWVISFSSVATALLLTRFAFLLRREMRTLKHEPAPGMAVPWALVIVATASMAWLAPVMFDLDAAAGTAISLPKLWDATWPLLVALPIAWLAWRQRRILADIVGSIPPGDVSVIEERVFRRVIQPGTYQTGIFVGQASLQWNTFMRQVAAVIASDWAGRTELQLASWRYLGTILLGAMVGFVLLLWWTP